MKDKFIWTELDINYVIQHYPHSRTDEIAKALGLTVPQVYSKENRLGLKKSEAFLASQDSGRTDGTKGKNTRFQAGFTPWNKGKPYQAGGLSVKTQFKPGDKPRNWKPVGSYRVNGEGYLDKKINDLPGANTVRWHPVHRLVWIEANGTVPDDHIICFKPGMKTNVLEEITIDRLECITRAENAMRHRPYARGEDFGHITMLKAAITRHVNRIIKEQKEQS